MKKNIPSVFEAEIKVFGNAGDKGNKKNVDFKPLIYLDNLGIYFLTKFQHLISFYKYVAFFGGFRPFNQFFTKIF